MRTISRRVRLALAFAALVLLIPTSLFAFRLLRLVFTDDGIDLSAEDAADFHAWVLLEGVAMSVDAPSVAVVMMNDGYSKHAAIAEGSIANKRAYAAAHGYAFIVCPRLLDVHRLAAWSKLKLVHHALLHYDRVVWMDVDTIIRAPWSKDAGLELVAARAKSHISASSVGGISARKCGLIAQRDFGAEERDDGNSDYFNAGVVVFVSTEWTRGVLSGAYDRWHIVILQSLYRYFDSDQDALNEQVVVVQSTLSSSSSSPSYHACVCKYGKLWALAKHRSYTSMRRTFAYHFPGWCDDPEKCTHDFVDLLGKQRGL
jgi:hypothetical protein